MAYKSLENFPKLKDENVYVDTLSNFGEYYKWILR